LGICVLLVGNGLLGTPAALRISEEGFDLAIIAVVLSCYSIDLVIGCLYGQQIIQRGDQPSLADVTKIYPWISLHLIFGLSSAMFLMVAKSWLTRAASSERKVGDFLRLYGHQQGILRCGSAPPAFG
jgi:hypothetical protein